MCGVLGIRGDYDKVPWGALLWGREPIPRALSRREMSRRGSRLPLSGEPVTLGTVLLVWCSCVLRAICQKRLSILCNNKYLGRRVSSACLAGFTHVHTENTRCPTEDVTHRGASTGVLSHLLRTRCDHGHSSQGTGAGGGGPEPGVCTVTA